MTGTNQDIYEKVKITFEMESLSQLHIGSGEQSCYTLQGKAEQKFAADICQDASGNPYIPASSLRGYLSRQIDKTPHEALFGSARNDETGGMGKLRVYDARYQQPSTNEDDSQQQPTTGLTTRTSIDPITGVAKKHHLITQHHVNKGVRFKVLFECDQIEKKELDILIAAIKSLDGSPRAQLGKGKTLMKGAMKAEMIEVNVLTQQRFKEWLSIDQPIHCFYTTLAGYSDSVEVDDDANIISHTYKIKPTSPILVNDIHQVSGKSQEPDHVFMSEDKRLLIPASTLKGLLRAHCRKILLTMMDSDDDHEKETDNMLECLFGNKNHIGLIFMSDAISDQQAIEHEQTFIAIDRFTGGVSEGALYMAKAACVDELNLQIHFDKKLKSFPWAYGLLYLVLRDAMEGDLHIGWGKAKGYGAFLLMAEPVDADGTSEKTGQQLTNWLRYYNSRSEKILQAVKALEEKLDLKEYAA